MLCVLSLFAGLTLLSLGFAWADDPRPGRQLAVSLVLTLGLSLALPAVVIWLAVFSAWPLLLL